PSQGSTKVQLIGNLLLVVYPWAQRFFDESGNLVNSSAMQISTDLRTDDQMVLPVIHRNISVSPGMGLEGAKISLLQPSFGHWVEPRQCSHYSPEKHVLMELTPASRHAFQKLVGWCPIPWAANTTEQP
uniref:Uncharacterized protein n=1 Tax=Salvator merianae TaxID=96440 RepID=A0A8D0C5I7_SALMN